MTRSEQQASMDDAMRRIAESRHGFYDQFQVLAQLEEARRAKYDEAAAMDAKVQRVAAGKYPMMYDVRYIHADGRVVDEHWRGNTWSKIYAQYQALADHGHKPVFCRPVADTIKSQELAAQRSALYDEAAEIEAQIQELRNRHRLSNVEQDN